MHAFIIILFSLHKITTSSCAVFTGAKNRGSKCAGAKNRGSKCVGAKNRGSKCAGGKNRGSKCAGAKNSQNLQVVYLHTGEW